MARGAEAGPLDRGVTGAVPVTRGAEAGPLDRGATGAVPPAGWAGAGGGIGTGVV